MTRTAKELRLINSERVRKELVRDAPKPKYPIVISSSQSLEAVIERARRALSNHAQAPAEELEELERELVAARYMPNQRDRVLKAILKRVELD